MTGYCGAVGIIERNIGFVDGSQNVSLTLTGQGLGTGPGNLAAWTRPVLTRGVINATFRSE
jgi:hypothetical protein